MLNIPTTQNTDIDVLIGRIADNVELLAMLNETPTMYRKEIVKTIIRIEMLEAEIASRKVGA